MMGIGKFPFPISQGYYIPHIIVRNIMRGPRVRETSAILKISRHHQRQLRDDVTSGAGPWSKTKHPITDLRRVVDDVID